jgi:hypothetical protein
VTGIHEATTRAGGELANRDEAVRQLERAELYVTAAIDLCEAQPDQRRLLEGLRADVVATRRSLTRRRMTQVR